MSQNSKEFSQRHIGLKDSEINHILHDLGYENMEDFLEKLIPNSIYSKKKLNLPEPLDEPSALRALKEISKKNKVFKTFIGQGFYNCNVPAVIKRNVFENPGWYTSYTPYQPEIAQGRLEALMNYQTMVSDLTGMDISNASLLDEPTSAAEAMMLAKRVAKSKSNTFFVNSKTFKQTIAIIKSRAKPLGVEIEIGDRPDKGKEYFAAYFQYPNAEGSIEDLESVTKDIQAKGGLMIIGTDLLALTLLKTPGDFGADIAVGSAQRFGVPMGVGGPHAGFMAVKDVYKRSLPGRLIGLTQDSKGRACYRLALQTREQHNRREKATSNICTAQALLAIMSSFYAIYHGPNGLKSIASDVKEKTLKIAKELSRKGYVIKKNNFFDTLVVELENPEQVHLRAKDKKINLRVISEKELGLSFDEMTTDQDVNNISELFEDLKKPLKKYEINWDKSFDRKTEYLNHEVFNSHHSETQILRYI